MNPALALSTKLRFFRYDAPGHLLYLGSIDDPNALVDFVRSLYAAKTKARSSVAPPEPRPNHPGPPRP